MKERETRIRFKKDFDFFANNNLVIRIKVPGSLKDIKLTLNKPQRYLLERIIEQEKKYGRVRIIIVKGRQQGCSTLVGAYYFWKVIHQHGLRAFILTHVSGATKNLFEMTNRFYANLPHQLKPYLDKKNSNELSFSLLDSGYNVGTAGSKGVGRSDTIQLFHGSEVGLWENPEEIESGIMQAIPDEGSYIILESTAKGQGNYFHREWLLAESGESDFEPIFIPWFWSEEYSRKCPEGFALDPEETEIRDLHGLSNEQMCWRRFRIKKMGESLFKQEYPMNAVEAFQATTIKGMISNDDVMAARKCTSAQPYGPIIIGVDPAYSENGDRTAIICRQGRVAYGLQSFKTKDTMHVVGILHNMIKEGTVDAICIDVIGIGAGIVDRLRELGYSNIVKAINVGNTAYNPKAYKNIKAQAWDNLKAWLKDKPCKIPDVDSLNTDLCAPQEFWNSNSQKWIESKDSLKTRGFDSTDEADALVLTFAVPINPALSTIKKSYSNILRI